MTTPHRTLREAAQMALDALDAITDDVDGTGLNTMPSFDKAIDAITALREALAAPEPEPVAWQYRVIRHDKRSPWITCQVGGDRAKDDVNDTNKRGMEARLIYAAPPAAPATAVPAEDFCYCNDEISLQMVSGGAASEGLYGRLTLKIDGKYVEYVRAESAAPPAAPADPWRAAALDRLAALYMDAPQDEPPESILRRIIEAEVAIALDPRVSDAAPAAPVVPLTEGRITAIANELAFGGGHCNVYELARAIEAALGITGGKP